MVGNQNQDVGQTASKSGCHRRGMASLPAPFVSDESGEHDPDSFLESSQARLRFPLSSSRPPSDPSTFLAIGCTASGPNKGSLLTTRLGGKRHPTPVPFAFTSPLGYSICTVGEDPIDPSPLCPVPYIPTGIRFVIRGWHKKCKKQKQRDGADRFVPADT